VSHFRLFLVRVRVCHDCGRSTASLGYLGSDPGTSRVFCKILMLATFLRNSVNTIPTFSLTQQYAQISDELNQATLDILASGRYIGGPIIDAFEQAFSRYIGTATCISCNSGTDALYLSLRALDIGPGDEVITTPFTFVAPAEVITAVGAKPVFVDIQAHSFNLDPSQVAAAITPKTRALLPVHLFGQSADMTRLMAIAQDHCLAVIEDCAQATGATWQGRPVGSIGTVGCFSFYPTKNLGGCGDGGAIATNDPALAQRIRQLKNHGQGEQPYHSTVAGINSRLDALQAGVLQIKLKYLDQWNAHRRKIAENYSQGLGEIPDLTLPQEAPGGRGVWNQYTIRVPSHQTGDRNSLRQYLQNQGICTAVYYPLPLHQQTLYQSRHQVGQFPQAELAAQEVLSLPMFPELSWEQQDRVVMTLKDHLV